MMETLPFPHQKNKSLSLFSTFGIGGPACYIATAKSVSEMVLIMTYCHRHHINVLPIGKGSNVLFDDRGFNGLILLNRIEHFKQDKNRFCVGGGYSFPRLGMKTAKGSFSGLEFAAGIPASVGGAVFMNAGAGGQQTGDVLESVLYVTGEGELMEFSKERLLFGYRTSSFQSMEGVIGAVTFALTPSSDASISQKSVVGYRLQTQPYGQKSAGCAFRNPKEGSTAGSLIESAGLKGLKVGGAVVSNVHANFIVNEKGAKAHDVRVLMAKVQERVFQCHGIQLESEIRVIPYEF